MPESFQRNRPGIIEDPLGPIRDVVRRWRLLVACAVLGGLLGWVSAVVAADSAIAPVEVDHYEAAHVLVLDSTVPSSQATLSVRNLNSMATRITIGEVPGAVAEELSLDAADAAQRVRVIIRPDSEALEIVAVAETTRSAEVLADE